MPYTNTVSDSQAYKVDGYEGIAWYKLGPATYKDEDYDWTGIEHEHEDLVRMVMVGDDRVFEVDKSDITPISEDEYCSGCGQIGCGH